MLGFLLVPDDALQLEEKAVARLKDSAPAVLDAALSALEPLGDREWRTTRLEEVLRAAIVEGLGIKPRLAFGPLRVAVTGRQVSPPLFESMEILGAVSSLARLIGAVLLEQHEEWQYGERRYLSETSLRHLTHTLHHDQHAIPDHNTITLNP